MILSLPRKAAMVLLLGIAPTVLARADDGYRVVHAYPHDSRAFTQGLICLDGHLYESTGIKGQSSLRMEVLETGKIEQYAPLPAQYFGEGLTNWGSTLIQLTWQSGIAFVYDRFSFRVVRTFHYPGEGWGLTQDGKHLILSDGSATLRFLDPATFREVRRVTVRSKGAPVTKLNELEYIHGEIYANIWYSDRIARISPATGEVLSWIDLSGLLSPDERTNPDAVLNGIAYDARNDRLFVTGKLWPKIFEIRIVPQKRAG